MGRRAKRVSLCFQWGSTSANILHCYMREENNMQSNPYPNDPNYMPPLEEVQPAGPPYQPVYQNQPGVPYAASANQYAVPPAQRAAQQAAQQKKRRRKYGVAKIMDYLQWVLFALEMLFLVRFGLILLGADPTNPFAQALYNFTGFFLR